MHRRLRWSGMGRTSETAARIVCLVVITASLAGCATAAQQQYRAMAENNRSAVEELATCEMALYDSPEIAPLRSDLPLNVNNASLEQLSNTSFANDVEIRIILNNHPKLQACRQQFIDQISSSAPTLALIFLAMTTKEDNDLVGLIQRKQSWGEFLQHLKEDNAEGRAALASEAQKIVAGLEQSHEAELARRQIATEGMADALARYGETQQIINSMNRQLNCTTISVRPGFSNMTCY
jgi:hypothetical protein